LSSEIIVAGVDVCPFYLRRVSDMTFFGFATRSFVTACTFALVASPAAAQQKPPAKPKPPAYLDVEEAPSTYWLQGEYFGRVKLKSSAPMTRFGLQVIDKGKADFEAVLYQGGLPGEGWDKKDPVRLKATPADGLVVFVHDDFTLSVDGTTATVEPVVSASAVKKPLWGSLEKVQRLSPTLGLKPPAKAQILFNGSKTDLWKDAKTEGNLLKEGAMTRNEYQDFRMHLEFQLAFKPDGIDQDRGNSGVYIQRRYELQILDSFGRQMQFNDIGSIYRQQQPDLNMALPPLSWQTYDIWFRAARFDAEGKKTENARITVWLNGVPIHSDYEIIAKTGAGQKEAANPMPINLQDHQNPVRFRNIWLLEGDIKPPAPLTAPKPAPSSSIAQGSFSGGQSGVISSAPPMTYQPQIIHWGPYAMPMEGYYGMGQPGWVPPPVKPMVGYEGWPVYD
jgi:hypothetical protein